MSLKREMLVNAGIEDKAVIDDIMQAYGAGVENAKAQYKAENDTLKEQLEQQSKTIQEMKENDNASDELKQQLSEVQAQFESYKEESDNKLAQVTKKNAIELALTKVGAHNPADLMKFIDIEKVELDESGKPQLEETIKGLKESSPYLFLEAEGQKKPVISVAGNPKAETGNGEITKEEFARMGLQKRNELFESNPELYEKLKG